LIPPNLATLLSVLVAYVLFGILESSGVIQREDIPLGGALVGFVVTFWLFMRFYRYLDERSKEQGLKPIVTLIFKKDGEMINVQLDRNKCFYKLRRYEGEKLVDTSEGKISPIPVTDVRGRYYCKPPILLNKDMQITMIFTQQDGKKWEAILDPEDYTLEATPCF